MEAVLLLVFNSFVWYWERFCLNSKGRGVCTSFRALSASSVTLHNAKQFGQLYEDRSLVLSNTPNVESYNSPSSSMSSIRQEFGFIDWTSNFSAFRRLDNTISM